MQNNYKGPAGNNIAKKRGILRLTPILLFTLAIFALSLSNARAEDEGTEIKVLLSGEISSASFSSSPGGALVARSEKSGARLNIGRTSQISVRSHSKGMRVNKGLFPVTSVRIDSESGLISFKGKRYKGYIVIHPAGNRKVDVVNRLDMKSYLQGVIPSEMPADWPLEALKAQAVAARTYAVGRMIENRKNRYHVSSDTGDQVYGGIEKTSPRSNLAVKQTDGMVLSYKNQIAKTYYHSTSGEYTEAVHEVFSDTRTPYLKSVYCPYDKDSPYESWRTTLTFPQISKVLAKNGIRIGQIRNIWVKSYTKSGRVRELVIEGSGRKKILSGAKFRTMMGPTKVKSAFFRPKISGKSVRLTGKGYGHGVGMCQWGAKGMAEKRFNFKTILSKYYPGTVIKPAYFLSMGN